MSKNKVINTTQTVESPCVRNCCLDDDDICLGCFRSINEIMEWSAADNKKRKEFLVNAKKRRDEK